MKKLVSSFLFINCLLPLSIFAWTNINHSWEQGDSIVWDVPYQAQGYFRNWTTACMPTSGAMIVNFFYEGASLNSFYDANNPNKKHPWQDKTYDISLPYQTTGERIYAQGIIRDNNYNNSLKTYLKYYPKNGLAQYYKNNIVNQKGPLKNEMFGGGTKTKTSSEGNTLGVITSLRAYLSNKHNIQTNNLTNSNISNIRNILYNGPIIVSVESLKRSDGRKDGGGHLIVIKGVTKDGDLIINDPWGADIYTYPTLNGGNSKVYKVNGSYIDAYSHKSKKTGKYVVSHYHIKYGASINVISNFTRSSHPFSPYNIPVEATVTFHYDGSGTYNENYNGDGIYAESIRNGFSYYPGGKENSHWNYYYNQAQSLGFLYTSSIQTDTPSAIARWTPNIPVAGTYEVVVGFVADPQNSSEVHYIVNHTKGNTEKIIDQSNTSNNYERRGNIVYKSLGIYTFNKGVNKTNGSVIVKNTSDMTGDINVDLVKFIQKKGDFYDGSGSLINANDECWGCNKDEADMHPHPSSTSSVSFQWYYDENICHHVDLHSNLFIDGGVSVYVKNWDETSPTKTYHIPFLKTGPYQQVEGTSIETNTKNPKNDNQKWNTILITTNKPLKQKVEIYAYCRSANAQENSEEIEYISKKLPDFHSYTWKGNASLISQTINEENAGFGYEQDYARTSSTKDSLIAFQWYRDHNTCYQLRLTNGTGLQEAFVEKVEIKQWSSSSWKEAKTVTGATCKILPCTLKSIFKSTGYAIVRVLSKSGAVSKGFVQAKCIDNE